MKKNKELGEACRGIFLAPWHAPLAGVCAAVSGRRARAVAKAIRVCDPKGLRGRRPPGPPAGGAAPARSGGGFLGGVETVNCWGLSQALAVCVGRQVVEACP